jgi:hypothetical protein
MLLNYANMYMRGLVCVCVCVCVFHFSIMTMTSMERFAILIKDLMEAAEKCYKLRQQKIAFVNAQRIRLKSNYVYYIYFKIYKKGCDINADFKNLLLFRFSLAF